MDHDEIGEYDSQALQLKIDDVTNYIIKIYIYIAINK
jgi:hypothetical protein